VRAFYTRAGGGLSFGQRRKINAGGMYFCNEGGDRVAISRRGQHNHENLDRRDVARPRLAAHATMTFPLALTTLGIWRDVTATSRWL